ncbi:MAG: MFS transporter [Atribacterota bacterium]
MNKGTIFRFYGMTVLAFFFLAISMVVTGAVLPHWMDLFQISASQAGRLIFLYYISYVIVTFLSGFLCDHFGKKPVLVLSQIFLAAGFFIISTADSFLTIEFGMLIMGLGGGFCEAPLTILISNVFSGKEGFALNMSQLFFGIGAATGPFLAGFILEKGITWRIMYIIPGIVSLFILFLLLTEKTLFAHDRKGIQKGGVLKLFQHWKCFLLINFLAMFHIPFF